MLNSEAVAYARKILVDRQQYWSEQGNFDKASTYNTAALLLTYAILEDFESLRQFDIYEE